MLRWTLKNITDRQAQWVGQILFEASK
jgi:hypothetical protein